MPDSPRYPDTGNRTALGCRARITNGMPRWVKISAFVVLVVAVLVVVMLLVGGGPGGHGPSRH